MKYSATFLALAVGVLSQSVDITAVDPIVTETVQTGTTAVEIATASDVPFPSGNVTLPSGVPSGIEPPVSGGGLQTDNATVTVTEPPVTLTQTMTMCCLGVCTTTTTCPVVTKPMVTTTECAAPGCKVVVTPCSCELQTTSLTTSTSMSGTIPWTIVVPCATYAPPTAGPGVPMPTSPVLPGGPSSNTSAGVVPPVGGAVSSGSVPTSTPSGSASAPAEGSGNLLAIPAAVAALVAGAAILV